MWGERDRNNRLYFAQIVHREQDGIIAKYVNTYKATKYEIQKTLNLARNKNICSGLKKVVAKSRARVYSEQQILALLHARFSSSSQLVAQQMCSCTSKSTNQRPAFLQPATNVFVAGQVNHAR